MQKIKPKRLRASAGVAGTDEASFESEEIVTNIDRLLSLPPATEADREKILAEVEKRAETIAEIFREDVDQDHDDLEERGLCNRCHEPFGDEPHGSLVNSYTICAACAGVYGCECCESSDGI